MDDAATWMFERLSTQYTEADQRLFQLENLIVSLQERAKIVRSERDTIDAALHILLEVPM
jgi:hypothetical protein